MEQTRHYDISEAAAAQRTYLKKLGETDKSWMKNELPSRQGLRSKQRLLCWCCGNNIYSEGWKVIR